MRKRTAQPTRAGQLTGTQLRIVTIHNDGLRESITVANQGTLAQPMCGWALATLRGERFYFFPDDVVMLPEMMVTIHSGQDALDAPPRDLLWAREQMWNNRGDVAVLFDSNGLEKEIFALFIFFIPGQRTTWRKSRGTCSPGCARWTNREWM